jgi:uncharacterized membrane protein YagU involved in acid resistance
MSASAVPILRTNKNLTAPEAILWGGLIAGALDASDGVVAYGLQGLNPIQVLQYIASGLLGKSSFEGGLATAGLGVLVHFFIAFVVASIYVLASRRIAPLRDHAIECGLVFGALVFLIMNYAVLPQSNVAAATFSLPMFLNGIIGHAVFVGLPIAWYARRVA